MAWIKDHIGLLLVIPATVVLYVFPLRNESILPDGLETLFDWAGEVVAYTWDAIAGGFLALWPVPILAGLTDRCPPLHTFVFIIIVVTGGCCIVPSSFSLLLCIIVGCILGPLLGLVYWATRHIRSRVMQRRAT